MATEFSVVSFYSKVHLNPLTHKIWLLLTIGTACAWLALARESEKKKFSPYSLESIPTLRAGCITIINFPPVQNFNPWGFHFTQTNYNHIFPSNNFFPQNSIMIIIIITMMMILIIIILISSWYNIKDICLSDKFMIDNKKNTHFVKNSLIKLWILTSPLTRVNKFVLWLT